jgi:hypothetical protein
MKKPYLRFFALILFVFIFISLKAENPVIKVDLNKSGRQTSETNQTNYTSWIISDADSVAAKFLDSDTSSSAYSDSITVSFVRKGIYGTSLTTCWYKAGVQNTTDQGAQLVSDGINVKDGNSGGQIEMRISGLPTGTHSLSIYTNTVDGSVYTYAPINIYINGVLTVSKLQPTNRATTFTSATSTYFWLQATKGEDVVLLFVADTTSSATIKNVYINGFEINTSDASKIAQNPFPSDDNEHVNADNGSCKLHWSPSATAVSHNVYFGTDEGAVTSAGKTSGLFMGNQTDTTYTVSGLYNMNKYYWRVDEVYSNGTVIKGLVWYFKPRHVAFNGAEGYGRYAIGGRGGKVVEVTNLNDSGTGSLREAVTNDIGPRTIIFKVSGIIQLESRLTISQGYITIAGQTAPGKGICIRSAPFGMSGANDVIIRNMRVRVGSGTTYDGMGMSGSDYCIIDHSSISWTIDEAFSSRSAKNITLQRTLISEALNIAGHQNYPAGTAHGYAASISGDTGTFHHNLIAHCYGRNWSLAGGLDANGYYSGCLDIYNNVVYNWYTRTTDGGAHNVNFVSNYYKPGPAWKKSSIYDLNAQYDSYPGTQQYYFAGNVMSGVFNESNESAGRTYTGTPDGYSPWVSSAFFPSYATIQTAGEAYKDVLSDVGCIQPVLDDHDIRVIKETRDSTYTYVGSVSGDKGLPDSQSDVGGYEDYPSETRADNWDTDHDGLPDWWENVYGLNTNSAADDYSDANADNDKDGYTNLEDYLGWMANPHYFVTTGNTLSVDLNNYTTGYTSKPVFSITSTTNCSASIKKDTLASVTFTGTGLSSFTFKVTDSQSSTKSYTVGVYVSDTDPTTDVKTEPEQNKTELVCYPNPVANTLFLSYTSSDEGKANVCITNAQGQTLLVKNISVSASKNTYALEVSSLKPGIYFVTLKSDKTNKTIAIIKK